MDDSVDFSRSPQAILLPILSAFAIVLSIPPLIWHFRNRGVAACSLIFWMLLSNVFNFVNALIWPTDDIPNWWNGVGLCDIEVKLTLAFIIGTTGSTACIMRNLARVLDTDRSSIIPSPGERKRRLIVDLLFCWGCPIFMMAVHYIVQPSRYYIFGISGCNYSVDNSWPSIVLIFIWSPIFCIIAAYYSVLVIVRMHHYRREFQQVLSAASGNLNKSRFLRLFIMSLTLVVIFLPFNIYLFYLNVSVPRLPYSWDAVHGPEWSDIIMVPANGQVQFDRWIRVASGLLVFFFFGMGKDAMDMYRKWLAQTRLDKVPRIFKRKSQSNSRASSILSSFGSKAKMMFHRDSKGWMSTTSSFPSSVGSPRLQPSPSSIGFFNKPLPNNPAVESPSFLDSIHIPQIFQSSTLFRHKSHDSDIEVDLESQLDGIQLQPQGPSTNIWSSGRKDSAASLANAHVMGAEGVRVKQEFRRESEQDLLTK